MYTRKYFPLTFWKLKFFFFHLFCPCQDRFYLIIAYYSYYVIIKMQICVTIFVQNSTLWHGFKLRINIYVTNNLSVCSSLSLVTKPTEVYHGAAQAVGWCRTRRAVWRRFLRCGHTHDYYYLIIMKMNNAFVSEKCINLSVTIHYDMCLRAPGRNAKTFKSNFNKIKINACRWHHRIITRQEPTDY